MKKSIVTLLVILPLCLVSCKKDKKNTEAFLGEYTITTTYNIPVELPVVGTYNYDRTTTEDGAVVRGEGDAELIVSMGSVETTGFVDADGYLHLEPITTNQTMSIGQYADISTDIFVTFPKIAKPVDGQMSWTSTVRARASIEIPVYGTYNIDANGTAAQVAVKK